MKASFSIAQTEKEVIIKFLMCIDFLTDTFIKLVVSEKLMSSMLGKLDQWDRKISGRIAEKSSKVLGLAKFLATSGNGQPWVIASILFFIFDIFMTRSENFAIFFTVMFTGLFNLILKQLINRTRPNEEESRNYVTQLDFKAFPSGHACRMGAMGILMMLFFPRIGWLFLIWALAVGYGRIALELHYFLDVLGGTVVGASIASLGYIFYSRIAPLIEPLIAWFPTVF